MMQLHAYNHDTDHANITQPSSPAHEIPTELAPLLEPEGVRASYLPLWIGLGIGFWVLAVAIAIVKVGGFLLSAWEVGGLFNASGLVAAAANLGLTIGAVAGWCGCGRVRR